MKRYINCLFLLIKHKWFVLYAYFILNEPCHSLFFRLLIHDLSKLYPKEFVSYAKNFFNPDGSKCNTNSNDFLHAWNSHQKSNKHHWQYYLLTMDSGKTIPLDMPEVYILEMLCDWLGAGRSYQGKYDMSFGYYKQHKNEMILSEQTRNIVEYYISVIEYHHKSIKEREDEN